MNLQVILQIYIYHSGKWRSKMKYEAKEIGKRIRDLREKRKWTQLKLGKVINVSGKQVSNYERGTPIPPIDVLIKLCDVFDCELGFILGEESYSEGTKLRTVISDTIGLSSESIEALEKITGTKRDCINFGHESEKYKKILNNLLLSRQFINFICDLGDMDDCFVAFNGIINRMIEKFGEELLNEAFICYSSTTDYLNDENAEKLKPELYEAIIMIDRSIDEQREAIYPLKIARYELCESFELLINDIYPRKYD